MIPAVGDALSHKRTGPRMHTGSRRMPMTGWSALFSEFLFDILALVFQTVLSILFPEASA